MSKESTSGLIVKARHPNGITERSTASANAISQSPATSRQQRLTLREASQAGKSLELSQGLGHRNRSASWKRDLFGAAGIKALSLPVAALIGLFATRNLTQAYGPDGLALYGLVLSVPLLIPFADMGLGGAAVEVVASREKYGKRLVDASLRKILLRLIAVASTLLAIDILLFAFKLWPTLLAFEGDQVNLACAVAVGLFCLTIPAAIGYRILLGLQKNWLVVLLQSLAGIISGCAIIAFLHLGAPLWTAIAIPQSTVLLFAILGLLLARLALKNNEIYGKPRRASQAKPDVKLNELAIFNLIIGIALPVAFQTGRLVLSHRSTVDQVAVFTAASQLYLPMLSLIQAAGQSLWPRFSTSRASTGSLDNKVVYKVSAMFGAVGAAGAGVLFVLGPPVAGWATAGMAQPSGTVFLGFGLLLMIGAANLPLGMSMMGEEGIGFQSWLMVLMAVTSISVSLTWAGWLGAVGPPTATAVASFFVLVVPSVLFLRRIK